MIAGRGCGKYFPAILAMLVFVSCGGETKTRRTLRAVGAQNLRTEILLVCRDGFAGGVSQKIPEDQWPQSVRPFHPLGLWAEPDGAYLLLDSDADGERGI